MPEHYTATGRAVLDQLSGDRAHEFFRQVRFEREYAREATAEFSYDQPRDDEDLRATIHALHRRVTGLCTYPAVDADGGYLIPPDIATALWQSLIAHDLAELEADIEALRRRIKKAVWQQRWTRFHAWLWEC